MLWDTKTLIIIVAVIRFVQVPILAYVSRVHRGFAPAQEWSVGSLFMGVAYSLVVLRGQIPDTISILGGNLVLIYGECIFNMGIARAAGAKPERRLAFALILAALPFYLYFTWVINSTAIRIWIFTASLLPYRIMAIYYCLSYRHGLLKQSLRAMAYLLAFDTLANLWRASQSSNVQYLLENSRSVTIYGATSIISLMSILAMVTLLAGQRVQEELALAKESADMANRAKSTFLTTMSHELRTPLNGILGFSQVLLASKTLTDPDRQSIATIQRSGEHLLTLINDVLDLAKVEAGAIDLSREPFDLRNSLSALVDLLAPRARIKGLELSLDCPAIQHTVVGDPRRLRQILLNLLGNAIKFTKTGSIQLVVIPHHNLYTFRVQDTGPGISPQDLQKLFVAFSQLGDRHQQAEGTGLGLSISRRLVEMMGGQLAVDSELDKGSCFHFSISLPNHESLEDVQRSKPEWSSYVGPQKRILVVDDILDNRKLCRVLLEPLGFEVSEAEDGPRALELAKEIQPHLILLDLAMPRMDGLEVRQELSKFSTAPVIMLTASAFAEDKRRALQAGCQGFLSKPLDRGEMLREITRLLQLTWNNDGPTSPIQQLDPVKSARLKELSELGDVQALQDFIAEVDEEFPSLAQQLRKFAQRYDFDSLIQLAERG